MCAYAVERIGFAYDLKNIIDLMRYLLPLPVPQRWRRRLIALGSGDPSRLICSALIADAFRAVRYPILPKITADRQPAGARADSGNPPLLAVLPARLRHLALFQRGQADDRARLRLQGAAMGRSVARRRSGGDSARAAARGGRRTRKRSRPDRPRASPLCLADRRRLPLPPGQRDHARRRDPSALPRCSRRRCARCCGSRSGWRSR